MRWTACLLVTLLAVTLAACGDDDERALPAEQVRIATGLRGGVYRVYGTALADLVNKHLQPLRASALTTDGSVENLQRLDERRAEVAFTLADTAAPAIAGKRPFARPVRIASVARLYDDYVQIIARRGSGLERVTDLAGKRVSIGARGSGTALTAKRILNLSRLKLRGARAPQTWSLPLEDSAAALAAGRIDAFFWSGGLPTDAIVTLRGEVQIKLVGLPAGIAADLDPDLYTETQIPRYVYGPEGAVRTVTAANLLVVRRDLPSELVFRLTRLLFDHQRELERAHPEARRLNSRAATATFPVPLHPGAERWYRRQRP